MLGASGNEVRIVLNGEGDDLREALKSIAADQHCCASWGATKLEGCHDLTPEVLAGTCSSGGSVNNLGRNISCSVLARTVPDLWVGKDVYLRLWHESDADETFTCVEESRAHLRPWLDWVNRVQSVSVLIWIDLVQ